MIYALGVKIHYLYRLGKHEATKRVEELTYLPQYKKILPMSSMPHMQIILSKLLAH